MKYRVEVRTTVVEFRTYEIEARNFDRAIEEATYREGEKPDDCVVIDREFTATAEGKLNERGQAMQLNTSSSVRCWIT